MNRRVRYSRSALTDFQIVYRHLFRSYRQFGETAEEARARATRRIEKIREIADSLGQRPYRGRRDDDLFPGLRHFTADRAVVYFKLDEDDHAVLVLGVFFGAENHKPKMARRLLPK
ncbi:type II toxin-antitoxin system RelE/ParE family toxin [Salinarimonas rosea]|uniref:type II toxin-antitoxin system RelE/ParE family toxin n=1 Tax=Salinarimonas rosea TaxID=552063 RepID=UPI00040606A9|nr:type II toxin-antitoxin system RelE/ParE family toxin [Salinarimonas rosea]